LNLEEDGTAEGEWQTDIGTSRATSKSGAGRHRSKQEAACSEARRAYCFASPLQDQTHRELVYHPLQFRERSQFFIGVHHGPLPVVAMCISSPDRSPFAIQR